MEDRPGHPTLYLQPRLGVNAWTKTELITHKNCNITVLTIGQLPTVSIIIIISFIPCTLFSSFTFHISYFILQSPSVKRPKHTPLNPFHSILPLALHWCSSRQIARVDHAVWHKRRESCYSSRLWLLPAPLGACHALVPYYSVLTSSRVCNLACGWAPDISLVLVLVLLSGVCAAQARFDLVLLIL